MKKVFRSLTLTFFILVLAGCSTLMRSYSGSEIKGTVVDAETNTPITGAIVSVNWQLLGPASFHEQKPRGKNMVIMETVTNDRGEYTLPAWESVKVEMSREWLDETPTIRVVKEGYGLFITNLFHKAEFRGLKTVLTAQSGIGSFVVDSEIKLKRMTLEEISKIGQPRFQTSLEEIYQVGCGWRKIPLTALEVDRITKKLQALNPGTSFFPLTENRPSSPNCNRTE